MSHKEITLAMPEDAIQIASLGYKSFYENKLEDIGCTTNLEKGVVLINESINNRLVLVKRNKDNPKNIDGVLGFGLDSVWFSDDLLLKPFLFYIKQGHRTFKLAKDFLNAAKEYAIINQLPIVFDLFAQKDVIKKTKLLKYMGFKECGSFFIFKP